MSHCRESTRSCMGRRAITADTGLRLARAFGLCDIFWINMRARHDADVARAGVGDQLSHIEALPEHPCGITF
jgi:antitoxin HigA-1